MNTLFTKILLWFVATMIAVLFTFVVSTAFLTSEDEDRQPPMTQLMNLQFEEARRAYSTGGSQALKNVLERFGRTLPGQAAATDGTGRDLVSGENRSEWIERAGERRVQRLRNDRLLLFRRTEDGGFWYFYDIPRRRQFFWFLTVQHLWILGLIALLCYALAKHLTAPVRQLQLAVDRFGRGELAARAGSQRRDELGQLAGTFDRMAERIETLLAAERRLLADVSHELRSPLARLTVALELARSGRDREAALNRIQKESDRLNSLVGELLEVTRAEGDPTALRREPVRLDELLHQLVDDSGLEAEARGCRVQFDTNQLITISADGELVRRAIENVVRNAIRYAPENTTVEVTLETGPCIVVRDYGPGAPEESLPRLFDPFYRVESHRDRATGGIGLGLAIARRAIEVHKGGISAENANPGLRVRICFPNSA